MCFVLGLRDLGAKGDGWACQRPVYLKWASNMWAGFAIFISPPRDVCFWLGGWVGSPPRGSLGDSTCTQEAISTKRRRLARQWPRSPWVPFCHKE